MKKLTLTTILITFLLTSCFKEDYYSQISYEINPDSIAKAQHSRDSLWLTTILNYQHSKDSLWLNAILNHIDTSFNKLKITVNVTVIKKDSITINNFITNNNTNNNIVNNTYIDSSKTINIYKINQGKDTTIYIHTTQTIIYQPIAYSTIQPKCNVIGGTLILNGLPDGVWSISPFNILCTGNSKTFTGLASGKYDIIISNANEYISPTMSITIDSQPPIPFKPTIVEVTQPTKTLSTGSVIIKDLPKTGIWLLTRLPDKIVISGTNESITIKDLKSNLTKCTETTYTFFVTNSDGCTSPISDNVTIKSYN